MSRPLEGKRILDLSRLLPGGFATQILADLGAEVIKIEGIDGDPSRWIPPFVGAESHHHLTINRNKKSIAINLKSENGRKIFHDLSKNADCILENFRPGVANKLKIDFATIKGFNEKIVYCSLTGFGQESPYQNLPAFDLNFQAMAGILQLSQKSETGKPSIPGILIADISASLWTVIAILSGLNYAEKTGKAHYIDLSMFDGLLSLLSILSGRYFADGNTEPAAQFTGESAAWNVYATKDDKYISLAAYDHFFWESFCRLIERDDLIEYDFHNPEKKEETKQIVQSIFRQKNRSDWEKLFHNSNIPFAPVKSVEELEEDPHIIDKNLIQKYITKNGNEFKFIRSPFSAEKNVKRPPWLGEHTKEILMDMGYDELTIEKLIAEDVIKADM